MKLTSITQPALFALEYSLAEWWIKHGVLPQAMLGHSIGEYVAACLADTLSLEDAIAVTAIRGRLMQECAPGSMLAVSLAPGEINVSGNISLAAHNAPRQCVISGPTAAVTALEESLTSQGTLCHRLQTSHAFHSSMMDPILTEFIAQMRRVKLRPPQIPFLSNVTGTWITAAQATDPEYWALHLRNTVRFSDCVVELMRQPDRVMLEVGPGQTLSSLVRQHSGGDTAGKSKKVFSSLRRREENIHDAAFLLNSLGQLWIAGQAIDWSTLHEGDAVTRIPLPTYPFERRRYWIDPDSPDSPRHREAVSRSVKTGVGRAEGNSEEPAPENGGEQSIDHWFYERRFSRTERPAASATALWCWLVLADTNGLGTQIALQLRGAGHDVVLVTAGDRYRPISREKYAVRPGVREDYDKLLADLIERKTTPQKIVHLWSVQGGPSRLSLEDKLDLSFYSLLFLAQALGAQDLTDIDISVVSDRLHAIDQVPVLDPVCATLLGPTKVIPKEFPGITCRNIDVDLNTEGIPQLAVQIVLEQLAPFSEPVVALRRGERWIESLEESNLRKSSGISRLRQKGVYLITGGLGDLGSGDRP